MITPRWVTTKTQPIAIGDVVAYLAAAADLALPVDREIQIGGPDVTTYGGMIDELAVALGRRPPRRLVVPVLTPGALLALDRPRHARRRRRRPAAGRGPRDRDRRHRSIRHGAVRGSAIDAALAGPARGERRRTCSFIKIIRSSKKLLIRWAAKVSNMAPGAGTSSGVDSAAAEGLRAAAEPPGRHFRAGEQTLLLLATPLNFMVLRALSERPMRLAELRRATGLPAQTTLRGHLASLCEFGVIEKRQTAADALRGRERADADGPRPARRRAPARHLAGAGARRSGHAGVRPRPRRGQGLRRWLGLRR